MRVLDEMTDLTLKCNCGKVAGVVHDVKPGCGNRLVCYCKDCQAFANHFGRDSGTLNEYGGTEIFQIAPALMDIQQGFEHVACLRLSEKGLYRWYASCCNTPIGNTVGLKLPFVGVIHSFISSEQDIDSKIGPVIGSVHEKYATDELPAELKSPKSQAGIMLSFIGKFLLWKIQGKATPNPFFDDQGNPVAEPSVVR